MPEAKKEVVPKGRESHRSCGWVPDLPDHRDYLYWAVRHAPAALPTRVDLRNNCSKVEDQGVLGSCTANALAGALEYLEKKDKVPCTDLSRLFIYYNERVIGHSIASDSGATLRDGIKTLARLPKRVDLRWLCSTVEDQGQLGSCTANALAGALEFLEKKDKVECADLSRLFIYYNERVIEHSVKSDSGAMLRDGIKTLAKQGACTEQCWPYVISRFTNKPSAASYREASDHQITSYHRILSLDEMRACLAEGFPFVFGFTVYEVFESQQTAKTGVVNMPKPGERALGGHAVLAVGYDDTAKRFIVRNSWGTKWGMRGYFTMPYGYVMDRNLSDDFWMIRTGERM